jgi:hypothetical protein
MRYKDIKEGQEYALMPGGGSRGAFPTNAPRAKVVTYDGRRHTGDRSYHAFTVEVLELGHYAASNTRLSRDTQTKVGDKFSVPASRFYDRWAVYVEEKARRDEREQKRLEAREERKAAVEKGKADLAALGLVENEDFDIGYRGFTFTPEQLTKLLQAEPVGPRQLQETN